MCAGRDGCASEYGCCGAGMMIAISALFHYLFRCGFVFEEVRYLLGGIHQAAT